MNKEHELYFHLVNKLAYLALIKGEVPVGAVVLNANYKVIGQGYNQVIQTQDPTAHAEIVAIRQACAYQNNYRLAGCILLISLEPCNMCWGAVNQARIEKVYFSCFREKDQLHYPKTIKGGIMNEAESNTLTKFFKNKR